MRKLAAGGCIWMAWLMTCGLAAAQSEKRGFNVIPSYRTAEAAAPFHPLTAKEKFAIGCKDSFNTLAYLKSAAYAGLYQLEDRNPSFGQGMKGYANRYVRRFGDQAIGNLLVESALPALLREDPRYFRRGAGGAWGRAARAMSAIFVTRRDSGGSGFNYAEVLGNASATAISNAYYPEERTAHDALRILGTRLASDSAWNLLKEFWPDIQRRLFKRHTSSVAK